MKSGRIVTWPAAALAALLFAAAPVLGASAEDFEFAKGLLTRKWYDMAEEVFRDLSKSGDSDDLRNKGELGLIDVLKKRAEDTEDPVAKEKGFDEAIDKYKKFLAGKSDPQALFNLAELLRTKGTEFTNQIKITEDEKLKKEYEKKAASAFEEATKLIQTYLDRMKKVRDEKGGIEEMTPDEQDQLRNAQFYYADLHYMMAKVFEGSMDKKIEILKKADTFFEEFIWDWEDFGQAFLGYVKRGQIAQEMKEYGAALDHFSTIMAIPQQEDATPSQNAMRDRLRIMGYHRYLETLVMAEKYEDAINKARDMLKEYPNCIEDSFVDPITGRAAALEKAKALAGLGRYPEAITDTVAVIDKGGEYMQIGMKLLGDWAAKDPTVGPRILLLQAQGLYQTRKNLRSIMAYHDAIDKLETDEEIKNFGPDAWAGLAIVYVTRNMYFEAALAYQEGQRLCESFLKGAAKTDDPLWQKAAECAYQSYRYFKFAWEATDRKSPYLSQVFERQRGVLTSRYQDSVFAKNLQFFAAQDQLKKGENLDAVNSFRAVDKSSDYYEFSLVGIGQAYFKEFEKRKKELVKKALETDPKAKPESVKVPDDVIALLAEGEKSFQEFFALAETKKVEGDEAESRRRLLNSLSSFFLGRIYDERGEWDNVLKTLDGFDEKYKDDLDLSITASFLRLRAHYNKKEASKVEDMVRIMEDTDDKIRTKDPTKVKKNQFLIIAYQLAGSVYGDLANEAKLKGEPEAYREQNEKAAQYLWEWIKADILADIENADPAQVIGKLDAVGIRLVNAKEFDKAVRIYDVILSKFGSQLTENDTIRFMRAVGECYINLEEWEKAMPLWKDLREKKKTNEIFIEKLVLCYTKLGDKFSDLANAKQATQYYDLALELYNELLKKPQPEKKQWWEWKHAVWSILYKKGEYNEVVKQVTNAKLLYPTLGGEDTKKKIEELEEKAKTRAKK